MTESITEIRINDKIFKAKGTYLFGKTAKKYTTSEVDEETGKKLETDGVTSIFMGLMQQDPDKLIEFWHSATSHYLKEQPSFEEIALAIEDIAEKEDLKPYFVGALRLLNEGGYYKGKLKTLWFMMERSTQTKNQEEKKKAEESKELFKELYEEITGKPPYNSKA
ncbi:tail assembly chaperone [Jeotgalicoccus marinus]|uniref:tail assembly chaperone n=1 Tax=Jeotgalicoccus marinus TaxID=516700 RepID=UPI00041D9703|nr:tail assembly chaperone [Jeotgalicoccus marinus]